MTIEERDTPIEPMLTTADVCRLLKISPRSLQAWMADGKFPRPRQNGRPNRWTSDQVKAWMNELPRKEGSS